jgi:cytochrome oxidase assembly protein ShyY1
MSFLATSWKRWLAWFLLAALFATACVFLAIWQLERRDELVSKIQRMVSNYDSVVIDYSQIASLGGSEVVAYEWHPIALSGSYQIDDQLLVRNRPIAGQPGFLQLVPFRLLTGELVLIERGWIPADSSLAPSATFSPGADQRTITARLRLSELTPNRQSPAGQVTSINLQDIQKLLALDLETDFYLRLISEPDSERAIPQPLGKPLLDEGNHLSYAVQWIVFALMGFYALYWAIRQEGEYRKMESDPNYVPRKRKKKRSEVDSETEDSLLDAN